MNSSSNYTSNNFTRVSSPFLEEEKLVTAFAGMMQRSSTISPERPSDLSTMGVEQEGKRCDPLLIAAETNKESCGLMNGTNCSHDEVLVDRVQDEDRNETTPNNIEKEAMKSFVTKANHYFKPFLVGGTIKNAGELIPDPELKEKETIDKKDEEQEHSVTMEAMKESLSSWKRKARDMAVSSAEGVATALTSAKTYLHSFTVHDVWNHFTLYTFLACTIIVFMSLGKSEKSRPIVDLKDFVMKEKLNNDMMHRDIDELNTDFFKTYSRALCVEGGTVATAREALSAGLMGIPKDIRE